MIRFWTIRALLIGALLLSGCSGDDAWPDGQVIADEPWQGPPRVGQAWTYLGAGIEPVADFNAELRVLGVERYHSGPTAEVLPVDLAVGWQSMSDSANIRRFKIWQGQRRYYYQWREGGAQGVEVAFDSANMHLIPGTEAVRDALDRVQQHDRIRVVGHLVNVTVPNYGKLRTSTRRTDTWDGACEIIWVERLEFLSPGGH